MGKSSRGRMACETKSSCFYSSFHFMVASLWPRIFHVLIDVSKSCRLPCWNAIRILLFCLVITWNLPTKSAIKVWNVFLDEGFQNWAFWGSHPLRHWIPSSCNVEKVVGENWLFQQTHPLPWKNEQTDIFIVQRVKHILWGSRHECFKWMETSQVSWWNAKV